MTSVVSGSVTLKVFSWTSLPVLDLSDDSKSLEDTVVSTTSSIGTSGSIFSTGSITISMEASSETLEVASTPAHSKTKSLLQTVFIGHSCGISSIVLVIPSPKSMQA